MIDSTVSAPSTVAGRPFVALPGVVIEVKTETPFLPKAAFVLISIASLVGVYFTGKMHGLEGVALVWRWLHFWGLALATGMLAWRLFYLRAAEQGLSPQRVAAHHAALLGRVRVVSRYLVPLLLWCVVSALPHYLAFDRFVVNILGTLFLGAATLTLLTNRQRLMEKAPAALLLGFVAIWIASVQVEYGPVGVALVVAWWWALSTRAPLAWAVVVLLVGLQNYDWVVWPAAFLALAVPFAAARLPLGLPRSGRLPWLFYPVHLAVLAAIDAVS